MAEQTYGEWIRSNPLLPTKDYKKEHMAQQTAVEWLFSQIPFEWSSSKAAFEALQQAKETEKQRHGETWDSAIKAHDNRGHVHARSLVDFDEWYEQQFKK